MSTDPQRQAVYEAEMRVDRWLDRGAAGVTVYGSTWLPEPEIKFSTIESVQTYCDRVLAHLRHPQPVKVRQRRGFKAAHYEPLFATIAIPRPEKQGRFSMRESDVLHELAHHLTRYDEAHGDLFVTAHLNLLERIGYPVRARLLQIAYAEAGVKPFARSA